MQPGAQGLLQEWPVSSVGHPRAQEVLGGRGPLVREEREANTGYGHQKGMAVGRPRSKMAPPSGSKKFRVHPQHPGSMTEPGP